MWVYCQQTGELFDERGVLIATGYAGGNCGANPAGINNPLMQSQRCIGPIPIGTYTVGIPLPNGKLGPFALPLIPDGTNEMFGRSAFFMHGDTSALNQSASEGCIIMPRAVREKFHASNERLRVVSYRDEV